MTLHRIRIVQVFRVEREIVITTEATDMQSAIDGQSESAAPGFNDRRWVSSWTLENEEVEPAR